jgi:2-oxo-4-hydroxy-4-carboxy-5-ureidoimidazoline decarboxylase
MNLAEINSLSDSEAQVWFGQACAANKWIEGMVQQRPYPDLETMLSNAKEIWQNCQNADYLEAFEAHPMIGDVNSLREKFASTKGMASHEQSGASSASDKTLNELSRLNHQYLQQFGFIFIICATGLSAETMLNALEDRVGNDQQTELDIAAAEQIKITLIRLTNGLKNVLE